MQTINATGVSGLTATLATGTFANGNGSLIFMISGTPTTGGTASFLVAIGGQSCIFTQNVVSPPSIPGNTLCEGATISATACSSVSGASVNDDAGTTLGIEYDWTGATGFIAGGTTQALIEINGQCWYRRNADNIPSAFNPSPAWANYTENGWSGYYIGGPYPNEGLLYQWTAAMNGASTERAQGICPIGWHIPSDCEWMFLENSLGMDVSQQTGTGWRESGSVGSKLSNFTLEGTNSSGFSGLLTGIHHTNGSYGNRGGHAHWWTSTVYIFASPQRYYIDFGSVGVYRYSNNEAGAYSVRCLKD